MRGIERGVVPGSEQFRFPIPYYMFGGQVQLVVLADTHGDEQYTKKLAIENAHTYSRFYSGTLVVPEVSPEATALGTRENGLGQNVNRGFYKNTPVPEARVLMPFIGQFIHKNYLFTKRQSGLEVVTWHSDNFTDGVYVYLSGLPVHPNRIDAFRSAIHKLRISLYNEIDDPNDPALGYCVKDGIVEQPFSSHTLESGIFDDWAILNGVKRVFCIEIPKWVSEKYKDQIADIAVQKLMLGVY